MKPALQAVAVWLALLAVGCSSQPPLDARACAALSACGETVPDQCLGALLTFQRYPDYAAYVARFIVSLEPNNAYVPSWKPAYLAVFQNQGCVVAAAPDCGAMLACLYGGGTAPDCAGAGTADAGVGTLCGATDVLTTCGVLAGPQDQAVPTSVRCADLGLTCVALPAGEFGEPRAACADEVAPTASTEFVATCDGTTALVQLGVAILRFDCAQLGSVCTPGRWPSADSYQYCVGARDVTCNGTNWFLRCEGRDVVACINGREALFPCGPYSSGCRDEDHGCHYSDCDVSQLARCADDDTMSLSLCPGHARVSCRDLGFLGCTEDGGVRCVAP